MVNVEVKKSEIHGNGLFAAKNFKAGETILLINDDYKINQPEEISDASERRFIDQLDDGSLVLMTGIEKYCNWPNEPEPNSHVKYECNKRYLIASNDIDYGIEITSWRMSRIRPRPLK